MNHRIAIISISGILACMGAHAAQNYLPDQFDQFKTTNSCINCDLSEIRLYSDHHNKATLTGSDLMKASINYTEFTNSDFTAAVLVKATIFESTFMNSKFDGANLLHVAAKYSHFSGGSFVNSNLGNGNFSHSNFSSADLTEASLSGANLTKAIFIGAKATLEQLKKARSLTCAVLPDGTVYNPNHENCRSIWM